MEKHFRDHHVGSAISDSRIVDLATGGVTTITVTEQPDPQPPATQPGSSEHDH